MTTKAKNPGHHAERHVLEEFDLEKDTDPDRGWADLENPRTGARYQVKSATTRDVGEPNVRLWEDHHRSLVAANARGTAWYVFVRLDRAGRCLWMQRRAPESVTSEVRRLGGWNKAGHTERDARQLKIPVKVFR